MQSLTNASSITVCVVSIHWTGLDWTTGLTFDPKMSTNICDFALIGSPGMLSCPFSDWEDTHFLLACSDLKSD